MGGCGKDDQLLLISFLNYVIPFEHCELCFLRPITHLSAQGNPVITSLETTSLPVEEIPFPAITICGQGLIREVVKSAIFKQFSLHVESKNGNLSVENMTQEEKTQHYQVCIQ